MEAHASDLNPVAVLINKALIEIPKKFKDRSPVNPDNRAKNPRAAQLFAKLEYNLCDRKGWTQEAIAYNSR